MRSEKSSASLAYDVFIAQFIYAADELRFPLREFYTTNRLSKPPHTNCKHMVIRQDTGQKVLWTSSPYWLKSMDILFRVFLCMNLPNYYYYYNRLLSENITNGQLVIESSKFLSIFVDSNSWQSLLFSLTQCIF